MPAFIEHTIVPFLLSVTLFYFYHLLYYTRRLQDTPLAQERSISAHVEQKQVFASIGFSWYNKRENKHEEITGVNGHFHVKMLVPFVVFT